MKTLLLTDMPPCTNYTAGLVLAQLAKFLPEGSLACYSALHPSLKPDLDPTLSWMIHQNISRPREEGWRVLPGKLGILSSFPLELYIEFSSIKKIINEIEILANHFKPDRIWCVLEGQTMFRLAGQVAKKLDLPLYTQIWDPPSWWLRANRVDFLSRKLIMRSFDEAMRLSQSTACASWAMAEYYEKQYGSNAIPVIPSLDKQMAKTPAKELHDRDYVVIGMAGQLYSQTEWTALLQTLDHVKWKVKNKKIRIRLLGRSIYAPANAAQHIEFLGWRDQQEVLNLLNEADILYCPYWFDPTFEQEARYSFPSKLTTYLAAGRPVIFHGPDYASPARFLTEHQAGQMCHDLSKASIYNAIEQLILDQEHYAQLAKNGHHAFLSYLTTDTMQQNFRQFLGERTSLASKIERGAKIEVEPRVTPTIIQNKIGS